MAAIWELRFSLVIICLVSIRGLCPLPTMPQALGTRPTRSFKPRGVVTDALALPPDDYYDDDEETATSIVPKRVSSEARTWPRCEFSLCAENQTPCNELAKSTNCSCPGITLQDEAPQTPDLKSVSWNGSDVVLRWCAPHSHVTAYVATVGGQRKQMFGERQRSGSVGHVEHVSKVCLFAVNEAGNGEASCKMYYPGSRSLPLTAGLVGGALGLLLLVLLGLLLWRHRKQRKQEASISAHSTAESL
ncbi:unnamed protein product [Ophioblennius macclurei]